MDDVRISRIEESRTRQGISIQQLADMSGISKSTVSRTLSGSTTPSEYTLNAMEEALGIVGGDPPSLVPEQYAQDPFLERYIKVQESRISRMRAYYNRELAEKDRWIHMLFVICLSLVALLVVALLLVESPIE